jgi:hypothetical protein
MSHMNLENMSLEINITFKYHEFLFETFCGPTREMFQLEMFPELVVVDKVAGLSVRETAMGVYSVADVTTFMFLTVVGVEFVERVERLVTKFAFRMAGKACEGDVFDGIAGCEVGGEFARSVEDMFVRKDFFVLSTERTIELGWFGWSSGCYQR